MHVCASVCVCVCVYVYIYIYIYTFIKIRSYRVLWVLEHSFCLQGKEYELKESEKRSFLLKKIVERTVNQVGEEFRELLVAR